MAEFSNLNGYDVKDKKAIRTFDTVADMKADENLKAGQCVATLGYYSVNDGGGAEYSITDTLSNTDYQEELISDLYGTLIVKDYICPEQLGAKGDGITDDSSYIINSLNICKKILFNGNKNYAIKDNITITNDYILNGNNCKIILSNGKNAFIVEGNNNVIENFKIIKNGTSYYGINISSTANNTKINNIYGENLTYSLIMNNGTNSIIENCYAYMCGWDCVSNYTASKNAFIVNCKAIKCGRHGFSCDVGTENMTIENCYAENIGYITGEGHSSFHIEGGKECTIRNCHAVYDSNHLKFSETFTGILTACRIEGSYTNYIDGLKIDISGSFEQADLLPLYFHSTGDPNIYINNLCINNTNSNLLGVYLSRSYLYITNSIFNGKTRFRQVGTNGIIKKLNNCKINMGSTDTDYMFYQARYKADGLIATNNLITNSKNLIEGRVINSIIKNNVFENCNESVFLTQAENNSAEKSQKVDFNNNVIKDCSNGIRLGWAGDENIFIYNNIFKGTINTILLGSYITAHVFNNIQQALTYTTLKTNVTVSTNDDSLTF